MDTYPHSHKRPSALDRCMPLVLQQADCSPLRDPENEWIEILERAAQQAEEKIEPFGVRIIRLE